MTDRYSRRLGERDKLAAGLLAVFAAAGTLVAALRGPLWLTVSFAVLALLSALAGLGLRTRQIQVDRKGERRAAWRLPLMRVREALDQGLGYLIGVDAEAPESLAALGLSADEHPAYLPRQVDGELRARLDRARRDQGVSVVIVSGPAKAGKSRALLEAAGEALGDAWLLTPRTADAVAELAEAGPRGFRPGPCVVWLDDLEEFARRTRGLNPDTIEAFGQWNRTVVILATQGGKGIELAGSRARRFREVVGDLLTRYPALPLDPVLTPAERGDLADRLPAKAAERVAAEGLGEFMIAAPRLLDRLRNGESPEGRAIAAAAIDLQRAGLLRFITVAELREVSARYLSGPPGEERFLRGLEWAARPLYSNVALLLRDPGALDEYRPHDYLVDHVRRQGPPIEEAVWDTVVNRLAATEDELLRVATVAYQAEATSHAEAAWRRADSLGSAAAAYSLGRLLAGRGDTDAAEQAYLRAAERGNSHAGGALGVLLAKRGELDRGEAALRRADEHGDPQSACWLGWLLESEREDRAGAEAAYRRAEERGHWHGASQLGWLLREEDPEAALAACRRADEHGDDSGASRHGWMLARRGDKAGAEAAYSRADERGHGAGARLHGWMLEQRGDLEAAEAAYARADEREDWRGTAFLGFCQERRGEIEKAEETLRRADEHGDGYGSRKLGLLLWSRGDLEAAVAALRRAAESDERRLSLRDLGHLCLRREEVGEAVEAFELLEAEGDPDGALELGNILEDRGDPDGAAEAFERAERLARLADNRGGDSGATCTLGRLLLRREDLDGAEEALRRAADEGEILAMNWLGWILHNERGDSAAALAAYRRADIRADAHGACCVGILLRDAGSIAAALSAFERSDTRGHAEGSLRLGHLLIDRYAEPDTRERALAAYRRALQRAEAEGKETLAEQAADAIEDLLRIDPTLGGPEAPEIAAAPE